jgi:transcriptional regulator with XRE-family HTH domain
MARKGLLDKNMEDFEFRAEVVLAEIAMEIARTLQDLRVKNGLSQAVLAERMQVKQSQISRYENTATATFTLKSLAKLADALECDLKIELTPKLNRMALDVLEPFAQKEEVASNKIIDFTEKLKSQKELVA